jgi:hypothetical protein
MNQLLFLKEKRVYFKKYFIITCIITQSEKTFDPAKKAEAKRPLLMVVAAVAAVVVLLDFRHE